ncbi:MAG TPA: type II secretion system F family protein [Polyangiaceae bacterium]
MPHGYALFRYLVAVAFGSALSVVTYAVVGAPTRVASRLGMRGLKRRRAIENNPIWAQVEPLVRWFGVRVSGLLSDSLRTTLDEQLALAGDYMGLTPEEYVGLSIVSFVGGAIFGVVAGLITGNVMLLLLVCAPMGAGLPYIRISGEQQRRLKQINRGLPYAIDLIALGMSAGLDFPGAVKQVVEKSSDPSDALVEELMRILQELQLGRTRKQALSEFAKRAPTNSVNEFVSAMVQAEDRGNPVAEVLIIQAGVSRQRRTVQAEEAAAKAGVAMVLPLMLLFLCIMILIISPMILKLAKGL